MYVCIHVRVHIHRHIPIHKSIARCARTQMRQAPSRSQYYRVANMAGRHDYQGAAPLASLLGLLWFWLALSWISLQACLMSQVVVYMYGGGSAKNGGIGQ